MTKSKLILTIGHSTHSWEHFASLLRHSNVTAIADVRSAPYSRYTLHFNREELTKRLPQEGIAYVYLGQELGGRPRELNLFSDGIADYEKMEKTERFKSGLERVIEGAARYRIALMCSEHDPLDCHRCLLIGRRLAEINITVEHILSNGKIESHGLTEERLLNITNRNNDDLLAHRTERLAYAYRERGRKVAYTESEPDQHSSIIVK